jgi:hypothetical protein
VLDQAGLLHAVCPPLDGELTSVLLRELVSMERRYALRDWEPATLDGGQFTEAASRILYHQDSTNLNKTKGVASCLNYIEDSKLSHAYPDAKSARHTAKVLRAIYKFRSDRGAIHIAPGYTANQMDAKLLLDNARWVLAEILRVFWTTDQGAVAKAIRELIQFEIPVVGQYGDRLLVQRTDCTIEEEILILLHHAGEDGLSRTQIGEYVGRDPSSVTRALQRLISPRLRQIIKLGSSTYHLTDIGSRRVLQDLAEKLIPSKTR